MIAQAILPPAPVAVPTVAPVIMPRPPLLLTVPQVADELGVSVSVAKQLVARGTVPSVKLNGCRRIRYDALAEYVSHLQDDAA